MSRPSKANRKKAEKKPSSKTRLRRDPGAKRAEKRARATSTARKTTKSGTSSTSKGSSPRAPKLPKLGQPIRTETLRLNKIIADSGLCSRRTADRWITDGRVTVNLEPVTTVGTQVSPQDIVLVDGNPLPHKQPVYILFHKPVGVLTTRKDEKDRDTIYDVLPKKFQHCDPAGRLDRQSSGALILSNDGQFIHKISHPSFPINKVYRVKLDKPFAKGHKKRLKEGVLLEPENKLAKVIECQQVNDNTLTLTLRTGYNRQIRRTLALLGYEVLTLRRLAIGPIELKRLAVGKCRAIEPEVVKDILNPPQKPRRTKPKSNQK